MVAINKPLQETGYSQSPEELSCPRCEAQLFINYGEPLCVHCGYVDYFYTPPQTEKPKKSIISTATSWVVRYGGDSPALSKNVIYVKTEREGYSIAYKVSCPYCKKTMAKSSRRSSRWIEKREERHKCDNGHIVTLMWSKSGQIGWK